MNDRVVYMNGGFIPEKEARISIYCSALQFGDCVFEMTRGFNQKHFKLEEHINRLFDSMKYLDIKLEGYPKEYLIKLCESIKDANKGFLKKDDEPRLMLSVYRGALSIYQNVPGTINKPYISIALFPLRWTVVGFYNYYSQGINIVIPNQRQIPSRYLDPKIKNRNRIHYLKANMEVSGYSGGNNWALLLDEYGYLTEGTGSNFFMVKNDKLYTSTPHNILNGISRAYIKDELAPSLGIECIEKDLELFDLTLADEAFFCATPFCIVPATKLFGNAIGRGKIDESNMTMKLLKKWSENVDIDIVEQIKNWDTENTSEAKSGVTPYKFK